ncbi:MAG: DUF4037 domain-containing protein [Anaerolineae bacterium]|nr:DUF4037 domain-containing protein [Anaerolineae bacterium]
MMIDDLQHVSELQPLLRQFCDTAPPNKYGIALGGAHAKGVADAESDLDLYVFADQVLPGTERKRLCTQFGGIESVTGWGEDMPFVQAGTDFYYRGLKVECWLRNTDYISNMIAECQAGVIHHNLVTWTVMGFYNYCALSDLNNMMPIDDPSGILSRWKDRVGQYPPKLRQAIITTYLGKAKFWPHNFHYRTAVERCDTLYVAGIVQQVVHNLIQVVFALNQVYFPGDKKLSAALDHLPTKPDHFTTRIQHLISPSAPGTQTLYEQQRQELIALVQEIDTLVRAYAD